MSTIISNSVQNFSVTQKEFEQTNVERQRVKAEKSQDYDSGTAKNTEDTVQIESSFRRSISSKSVMLYTPSLNLLVMPSSSYREYFPSAPG